MYCMEKWTYHQLQPILIRSPYKYWAPLKVHTGVEGSTEVLGWVGGGEWAQEEGIQSVHVCVRVCICVYIQVNRTEGNCMVYAHMLIPPQLLLSAAKVTPSGQVHRWEVNSLEHVPLHRPLRKAHSSMSAHKKDAKQIRKYCRFCIGTLDRQTVLV